MGSPDVKNIPVASYDRRDVKNWLAKIREAEEREKQALREGRPFGRLPRYLVKAIDGCNVAQLKRIKKICDSQISTQKQAPEEVECEASYILKVLVSVCVKNKRYQLEIRRSSLRNKSVYVNGPYLNAYWRDGRVIRKKYLRLKRNAGMPRKVWAAIRPFRDQEVIRREIEFILKDHETPEVPK